MHLPRTLLLTLLVTLLAVLGAGCGGGRLPPPRILKSGCHVWYGHGYVRQGYYAEMYGNGAAKIEGLTVSSARRASPQSIEWEGELVGKVLGSQVQVGQGTPFHPTFVVDLLRRGDELVVSTLAGKEWTRLGVSPSCSIEDAALGAAPLTLVIANGGLRHAAGAK